MEFKNKGLISYLLIICILINGISYAAAGINTQSDNNQNISMETSNYLQYFPDISRHWCREFIEKFSNKKWVVGYDDGLFRPDKLVTRAEFTAMVVKIFKRIDKVEENNFSDVKKGDWFYNVVSYAAVKGLIAGYNDGTFKPKENISRQDAAVLVARLFEVDFFKGAKEYNL